MCPGVPERILEVHEDAGLRMGTVDFGGVRREVCLSCTPDADVGTCVVVHVGFAITEVDEATGPGGAADRPPRRPGRPRPGPTGPVLGPYGPCRGRRDRPDAGSQGQATALTEEERDDPHGGPGGTGPRRPRRLGRGPGGRRQDRRRTDGP
ncbi:HypC/HybG/HupF family hydrogenase formation chaperone [Streptomyces sp. MNU76]|uniref:HypC/HybG/HupF family hydrogenase formation chaperone n=1 Tax=Streptomyces sp. MNU76 TaxID=2560026 RepID=UPI0027DFB96D|nr:HypC/HybG/HupF family hydrogenase formation chaperone [Streptomyces sp. MNU76]